MLQSMAKFQKKVEPLPIKKSNSFVDSYTNSSYVFAACYYDNKEVRKHLVICYIHYKNHQQS